MIPSGIVLVAVTVALLNGIVFGALMRWRALWVFRGWIVLSAAAFVAGIVSG